jgi:ribose/xylose/arabinose/galactoside ABC-type transport system permease subunit
MSRHRMLRVEVVAPIAALTLMTIGFLVAPSLAGGELTSFSVFNLLLQFAWLGPLTLAFGLTMMAGEFDLSVVGVASLSGVLAVKTAGTSPYLGAAVAIGAGLAIGLAQGLVISRLRISSVPVTLATYIALLGATLWISENELLSLDDQAPSLWFGQQVLTVLSPGALIALGLFVVFGVALGATTWGRDARAIGSERRASRAAGVRVDRVLVSLFVSSGALGAVSGVILSYTTSSANPNADIQPLILGVVGALAGGATLKGGRGRVPGLLAGALTVCLLQSIFAVTALADWLSQLLFASLLLVVAALDAPDLARAVLRVRSRTGGTDGDAPLASIEEGQTT